MKRKKPMPMAYVALDKSNVYLANFTKYVKRSDLPDSSAVTAAHFHMVACPCKQHFEALTDAFRLYQKAYRKADVVIHAVEQDSVRQDKTTKTTTPTNDFPADAGDLTGL